MGVACGAAALTRQEALAILVVVVAPAAILASNRTWGWRVGRLAVAGDRLAEEVVGDLGGAMGAALRVEHTVPPAGDLGEVADPDA